MIESRTDTEPHIHSRVRQICGLSGIIGIILPMVMIMTAIQRSPWFSWNTNVLSDLGTHDVSLVFNSAMILAGILSFIFIIGLRDILHEGIFNTAAVISLFAGSICLILIGIFTLNTPLIHTIVAYGYFTLIPVGILLLAVTYPHKAFRWLSLIIGLAALLVIYGLPLGLTALSLGFGVPELVETTLLELWVIIAAIMLLRHRAAPA